ncbi:hypothetical protein B566_EDAN018722 [Ephemera danica]|nr:hypothetical protein B566_EDAN018722 [Ephemera danica]
MAGFPESPNKLSPQARTFWGVRHELTVQGDLLLYQSRIVVPQAARSDILDKLHQGHMGITKARNLAHQTVYWPGLSEAIKQKVNSCSICAKYRVQLHEPMMPSEPPEGPWLKVAIDFLDFEGIVYLAVIDYFSKYLELYEVDSMTSTVTIRCLKDCFGRHGIPRESSLVQAEARKVLSVFRSRLGISIFSP